jgi:excisionase family DNA binding protein
VSIPAEQYPSAADKAWQARASVVANCRSGQTRTASRRTDHSRVEHRRADRISSNVGIEDLIETTVVRAVERVLGPFLHRLSTCEPEVFTIAQAAQTLQVSDDTIARMVRRGYLPRVPHVGTKVLIPRHRLLELVDSGGHPVAESETATELSSSSSPATGPSALQPPGLNPG